MHTRKHHIRNVIGEVRISYTMGSTTDVLPNVGSLEDKLERAKTNLKDLNENIRRIIGREPNDSTQLRLDPTILCIRMQ